MTLSHKLLFKEARVDQQDIGVAVLTEPEGLASADGDHIHPHIVLPLKIGQQESQQTGVLRARRGR